MKIIVGLGNPGKEYEETRHNTGWLALDVLANKLLNCPGSPRILDFRRDRIAKLSNNFQLQKKFKAEILKLVQNDEEILLVKPQTFMNASGEAVAKIVSFYKVKLQDIWLIHDDLDLQLGEYKLQLGKGPKKHNGVLSVEKELGTKEFWRMRIGIAQSEAEKKECLLSGKDYVLGKFSHKEKEVFNKTMDTAIKKLLSSYL